MQNPFTFSLHNAKIKRKRVIHMLKKLTRRIIRFGEDIIGKYELDKLFTKDKEIDEGLEEFIEKLYSKQMSESYRESYQALRQITKDFAEFPTIPAWNKYAQEHGLLNHISLQFIINLNWENLQRKVENELGMLIDK